MISLVNVHEIQAAISQRSPEELAQFVHWFAGFRDRLWNEQLQADVKTRKLDRLVRARRLILPMERARP